MTQLLWIIMDMYYAMENLILYICMYTILYVVYTPYVGCAQAVGLGNTYMIGISFAMHTYWHGICSIDLS